jgi:hypothetical protein
LSAWGWRVPFALGAAIGLTVFYLRRRMDESDDFLAHRRELCRDRGGSASAHAARMTAIIREYPVASPDRGPGAGDGMAHSLANAIFGGTTEMLALALRDSGHEAVFPWYIVATAGATLLALAFVPPVVRSVARVVPRVDVRRVDAQELGYLLDQDGQDQRVEVGAGLAAVLDGPAEQHEPRRLATTAAH